MGDDLEEEALFEKLSAARERIKNLERCLSFFSSVIKSGERWSVACEKAYQIAMEK